MVWIIFAYAVVASCLFLAFADDFEDAERVAISAAFIGGGTVLLSDFVKNDESVLVFCPFRCSLSLICNSVTDFSFRFVQFGTKKKGQFIPDMLCEQSEFWLD